MAGKDVAFLGNHGVIVAGARIAHAYDDLYYLERACMHQVLAQSTGRPLAPVDAELAARVAAQIQGEREQSDLFFEALRRLLPSAGAERSELLVQRQRQELGERFLRAHLRRRSRAARSNLPSKPPALIFGQLLGHQRTHHVGGDLAAVVEHALRASGSTATPASG